MSRRDRLIIFVKAPRLGQVKSRLARSIGASRALAVYRRLVDRQLRRLVRDRRWRVLLYVTPKRAQSIAWPRTLLRRGQRSGDLGRRMADALKREARPRAVLVGSDIPELDPAMIQRGLEALGQAPFVFGPAADGGYWLIGWRRGPWPFKALAGVRWSSRHALADSIASLGGTRSIVLKDRLRDLDDKADFEAYSAALRARAPDWRRGAKTSR